MKSYVWLTFGFMGWAYYEMSGGADFVPEERIVASVEAVEAEQSGTPEVVTRASSPTLLSVSTSNVEPQPAPEVIIAMADPVIEPVQEDAAVEVVALVAEPKLDIRAVAGSRVNMRMGPGTDYEVITTLDGGTEIEVLEVNAEGWANISTVDRGIEGWMAERLLTDPET